MTPTSDAVPPAPEELDALIRLVDDETPEVRTRVAERLAECAGDISEWLATRSYALSRKEKQLLEELLRPSRRAMLEREWVVPSGGATALSEDWDTFEAMLRTISDFLHDGITIRQPLSDALDLLAEEAEENGVTSANELRSFLFESDRLTGNRDDEGDPRNSDIAWSIAEGKSNPLGLAVVFILVARRLDLEVEGVSFPGHFLCRIYEGGQPLIVDCFDDGHLHQQSALLANPELGREEREILRQSASPGMILLRLLNNLSVALKNAGRLDDLRLIRKLRATLK